MNPVELINIVGGKHGQICYDIHYYTKWGVYSKGWVCRNIIWKLWYRVQLHGVDSYVTMLGLEGGDLLGGSPAGGLHLEGGPM